MRHLAILTIFSLALACASACSSANDQDGDSLGGSPSDDDASGGKSTGGSSSGGRASGGSSLGGEPALGGAPGDGDVLLREQLDERISKLDATIARLEALMEETQQALQNAQSEATATQASYDAALARNDELKEELSDRKSELAAFEATLASAEARIEALEEDKAALTELLRADLQAEIEALSEELEETKARIAQAGFPLVLRFGHTVGGVALARGTDQTTEGGTVAINEIRYWVSNLVLIDEEDEEYAVPSAYYLIEDAPEQGTHSDFIRPAVKREDVTLAGLPVGSYAKLRFSIGVDPTYNDNLSLHAGELHVLSNMARESWMWFTSYIFTKVKGSYTPEGGEATGFVWDTGSNASYRTIELDLPAVVDTAETGALQIRLDVQVDKLIAPFLPTLPASVGPSSAANMEILSDAYATAFSVEEVVE